MNQDLPLTNLELQTPAKPVSNVRAVARERSLTPPRPELANKWLEKRQQVWSTSRLRREPPATAPNTGEAVNSVEETQRSSAGWGGALFATEHSEWSALRFEQSMARALSVRGESAVRAGAMSMRFARAFLATGAAWSKGAGAFRLPAGLFLAGIGLLVAAGVQLFVIAPAVFLRHGLVGFANWTLRRGT